MKKFDLQNFDLSLLDNLKKLILERPLVAFDTETTGINTSYDEIIELKAIKIFPDGTVTEYYSLFNPQRNVEESASKIHGYTKEMLSVHSYFKDKAKEVYDFFLDCDLFAYNGYKFDIPLLAEEFLRCGLPYNPMKYNIIDPYNIMYKKEPRRLSDVYFKLFGETLEDAHSATADIIGSLRIFDYQIEYYQLSSSVKEISEFVKHDMNGHLILDFDSVFKYDKELGEVFYNKGKHINKKVKEHMDYLDWMIQKSYYSRQTKQMGTMIKKRIEKTNNLV